MKTRMIFIAMMFACSSLYAQLQVGMGINDFYTKVPEMQNLALLPLHPTTNVSMTAGTRMDAFNRHPMNASLLCSGFLIDHLGAGLKINYDQMGLSSQMDVELGLAYYVFLTKPTEEKKGGDKFSFFMAGHFMLDRLQQNDIRVIDLNDPGLEAAKNFEPGANASAGIAFLRENKYYVGISGYQLFPTEASFRNPILQNRKQRHYYAMGSYIFNLSQEKTVVDMEINAIGGTADFSYWQWQAGFQFRFLKMFELGAGVKSQGSLKFNLGMTAASWDFGYLCSFGAWNPSTAYTYKAVGHSILIRKIFNEGRRSHK